MRVSYSEAQAENSRRPTCETCYAPCAFDREYRATHLCQTCYTDTPMLTQQKELLCKAN